MTDLISVSSAPWRFRPPDLDAPGLDELARDESVLDAGVRDEAEADAASLTELLAGEPVIPDVDE